MAKFNGTLEHDDYYYTGRGGTLDAAIAAAHAEFNESNPVRIDDGPDSFDVFHRVEVTRGGAVTHVVHLRRS